MSRARKGTTGLLLAFGVPMCHCFRYRACLGIPPLWAFVVAWMCALRVRNKG